MMLTYMSPRFTALDQAYGCLVNAVTRGQGILRSSFIAPNDTYLGVRKFGAAIYHTSYLTAARDAVFHVLFFGAGRKVFVYKACAVVAAMANIEPGRNRTVPMCIGHPMHSLRSTFVTDRAVASFLKACASPYQTGAYLAAVLFKPFVERQTFSHAYRDNEYDYLCQPTALTIAAGEIATGDKSPLSNGRGINPG